MSDSEVILGLDRASCACFLWIMWYEFLSVRSGFEYLMTAVKPPQSALFSLTPAGLVFINK